MSPRHLSRHELALLKRYSACQMRLTPQAFYAKWNVTHRQIAQICCCSLPTVDRWFSQGTAHRFPEPAHLRRLAEMDFLLEHYTEIPQSLWQKLCSPE